MTVRIKVGHVLDVLRGMADESVHCVVSSPPYYGLRDYGIEPQVWGGEPGCEHEWGDEQTAYRPPFGGEFVSAVSGQPISNKKRAGGEVSQGAFCRRCNAWRGSLGLEPRLDLYLDHMVEVMREVRRVMRKDATCWLNIGDSYTSGGRSTYRSGASQNKGHEIQNDLPRPATPDGLKSKDLMLIPSRLAIRLQDDGWWVRSEIVWAKRAPMPESVTDRPTSAHEKIFLLTKSARYFWDAEAVKEESETENLGGRQRAAIKQDDRYVGGDFKDYHDGRTGRHQSYQPSKRNMRNFWLLGPSPFSEAHFATFLPEIPRRAILAGTSERGVCPKCRAPWVRVVKVDYVKSPVHGAGSVVGRHYKTGANNWDGAGLPRLNKETKTICWSATCSCDAGAPVPATVLDPFLGAGTTGLVADRLGRNFIGIELSPKYARMAERRLIRDVGPLVRGEIAVEGVES